ncbi:MAG: AAA family ATPase [Pseudomonadota bacterium]
MIFGQGENKITDFEIRVTNIRQLNSKTALFSGVATNNTFVVDGSTLIFVDTHPDHLGGMQPQVGQHWRVSGSYSKSTKKYDKYSRPVINIEATKAECIVPVAHEALIKFIANDKDFAGISESKARKLVKAFPDDLYRAVINNSIEDLADIAGLTQKSAERLKKGFSKYHNMKYANWLSNHGVPLSIVGRIIKYHDFRTIDLITENPWRLMDFGLSFSDASLIARRIITSKDGSLDEVNYTTDPRRIVAATEDAMNTISKRGHTVASRQQIIRQLLEKRFDKKLAETAIELAIHIKKLIRVDENKYMLTGTYIQEAVIAKRLLKLAQIEQWGEQEEKAFTEAIAEDKILSDPKKRSLAQKRAIQRSAMHGTSVITGGAGTGKTTVLRALLRTYDKLGFAIQGVAVSGRASERMHESTGCSSYTIAKYLMQDSPKHGDKYVLVIDEASMLDVQTMFAIVTHLPDTARIVFVGDVQQLPSIGPGRVFADIIISKKVPVSVLDKVRRQADDTGIPSYASSVIAGKVPEKLSTGNITFHDVEVEKIESVVNELVSSMDDEVQVIGMTHKGWKHNAGVEQINRNVQNVLNADGKPITISINSQPHHIDIRENDRVIFTRNNYNKGVWNGTLGKVVKVEQQNDVYADVLTDEQDIIGITHSLLFEMQLSYAITLHKAQGSQFKRIIVVLTNDQMLDRSWLYTAITRAETHVEIVGPEEKLIKAIKTESKAALRETNLDTLLSGNFVVLENVSIANKKRSEEV